MSSVGISQRVQQLQLKRLYLGNWRAFRIVMSSRGVLLALFVCGYALIVPLIAGESQQRVSLDVARLAPSWAHLAGTDYAGHDLAVRIALGMRMSLFIAFVSAVCATFVGLCWGTIAAAAGGWRDAVMMRTADAVNALPHLLLGVVLVALFRGSIMAIVVSIAATHWASIARIVRSTTLTTKQLEYVDAAYLTGATKFHVWRRHLVPAVSHQVGVALVMMMPHAVWHESTLSFLGLGISPDQPSLGTLLQLSRGDVLLGNWWTLVFPGLALVFATLSITLFARWVGKRMSPLAATRVAQ